ncbi:hypothetical protein [Hyphococcus sp.]|uniref:hypothetical protein n=1 Tax=Hyphococcus sp. TaxID=2038636 RepID=UPI003CCBDC9C
MDGTLSGEMVELAIVVGPGLVLALILLLISKGALRGSAISAFSSLLLMLGVVAGLGFAAVYGLNEWLVIDAIRGCEKLQWQGLHMTARTMGSFSCFRLWRPLLRSLPF